MALGSFVSKFIDMQETVFISLPLEELKEAITNAVKAEFDKREQTAKLPEAGIEYITRQQTAKILGISLPTLNDWSKRGLITSYRISSRVRYIKAEVENSLNKVQSIKYHRA